jgi:hypothetical protein
MLSHSIYKCKIGWLLVSFIILLDAQIKMSWLGQSDLLLIYNNVYI